MRMRQEENDQHKKKLEKRVYFCNTDLNKKDEGSLCPMRKNSKTEFTMHVLLFSVGFLSLARKKIHFHVPWFDHVSGVF